MSLPLVFQAGVRDEIDDAYRWYERQRQGLGEDFLAALQAILGRIAENPEQLATVFRDVRRARLRTFPCSVFYRVEPDLIRVLAVHHGKRDPGGWQSRA